MAITTRDQLIDALGNKYQQLFFDKASLSNAVAGQFFSLFTATGTPGAATNPTTAALCDNTTTGSLLWNDPAGSDKTYIGWLASNNANATSNLEIVDRLAHMGGLSGTSATSQTVNLDPDALGISAARRGAVNYSEVQWWMEIYSALGSTGVTATVNVDYSDGTLNQNLSAITLGGTPRQGRIYPLHTLAAAGKYIAKINSVTLSATTGAAGNFGFSATRSLLQTIQTVANFPTVADWAQIGLPEVPTDASLFMMMQCVTTSTGAVRGYIKLAQG